tara:strand:- start:529 stop:1302 length:774 start_codon:yes stop_codon:yes gene_type:complete
MGKVKIPGSSPVLKEISYSGSDIIAFAYIPNIGGPRTTSGQKRSTLFGSLQTISITSTRSVTPVRGLGRASPMAYSRGGRTFAGTLVFATLDRDPFSDIYRPDAGHESLLDSGTSAFVDQLPPFTVVITAANELGGIARQIVSGITLVNYGVTYSIDDIYTETTYTYVATDVTALLPDAKTKGVKMTPSYKKMSEVMAEEYPDEDGSDDPLFQAWRDVVDPEELKDMGLVPSSGWDHFSLSWAKSANKIIYRPGGFQ